MSAEEGAAETMLQLQQAQPEQQAQQENHAQEEQHTIIPNTTPVPKRPAPKYTWLITHGSSSTGARITAQLLKEKGNLTADECHSTVEQETGYTYVHLEKKARQSSIEKFMNNVRELGIEKTEIRGFDAIATTIDKHIVFRMLEKHIRERNPAFHPHTDGRSELTRGYLFKAVADFGDMPLAGRRKTKKRNEGEIDDDHRMQSLSKKQLVILARNLTAERVLAHAEKDQMRMEISKLRTDNAAITERLERLHEEGEGYV